MPDGERSGMGDEGVGDMMLTAQGSGAGGADR